jgi:hypothetical protein
MFGGLVVITGGHLTVGVYGEGLIARIGAADMGAAAAGPCVLGARPSGAIRLPPPAHQAVATGTIMIR